jgi:hypothetical protein
MHNPNTKSDTGLNEQLGCILMFLAEKMFEAKSFVTLVVQLVELITPGNTKGGSITDPLTSCLTGLELAV